MYRASSDGASAIVVSAFNGWVFGLRADNGQRLWEVDIATGGMVRLAIEGQVVVALGSTLCAIELHTGRVLWQVEVTREVASGTLLVGDRAIFVADLGEMAAFDLQTGRQLWYERFAGKGTGAVAIALPGASAQGDRSS